MISAFILSEKGPRCVPFPHLLVILPACSREWRGWCDWYMSLKMSEVPANILQHHSKPPRKQQLPQFPLVLKVRGLAYFVLFWRKRRIKLQKLNLTGSRDFPVESNCTRIFKVDIITNLAEFLLLLKLLPCNFKCRKYVWLLMISIKGKIT